MSATPSLTLVFDPNVFGLIAVKKAGYRFGDRCFVQIETDEFGRIAVTLSPKSNVLLDGVIEGEFRNEVLDQELRESIAAETERVRNLLLAQAFSNVSLIDQTGESANYQDDPLQISNSQTQSQ